MVRLSRPPLGLFGHLLIPCLYDSSKRYVLKIESGFKLQIKTVLNMWCLCVNWVLNLQQRSETGLSCLKSMPLVLFERPQTSEASASLADVAQDL